MFRFERGLRATEAWGRLRRGPPRPRPIERRRWALIIALAAGLGGGHPRGSRMAVAINGAGGRGALLVDGEVRDARVLAAHRALGIAPELDLAEAHAARVVGQEPPDQRVAHPDQELDGLRRLDHADHAWEHAQDPGLASAGHEPRRRRRRVETAIARPLVGG